MKSMTESKIKGILFFILVFLLSLAVHGETHGPATVSIASWNIQQFGETKSSDELRLDRIANVIKEFDVMAIQEIVHAASEGKVVVDRLTSHLKDKYKRTYTVVLGPRVGCDGGRVEQYAVLFDSGMFDLLHQLTVADDTVEADNMCRDPLVVRLKVKDQNAKFTFTLIVVHTDPDPLTALKRDLNALARIYRAVQANDAEDDDVILLGDLNAEPAKFEGLANIEDIVYAIPNTGTMVNGFKRNDNILFQWTKTGEDFTGQSGILRLADFLRITQDDAAALSDHQPVYAVFFTRRDTM